MRIIKRYANRKLYDLQSGSYISLNEIAQAIQLGEEIQVLDHNSGEDLTSATLMQVIIEQQKQALMHLPEAFFARLLQTGSELRHSVNAFLDPTGSFEQETRRRVNHLVQKGYFSPAQAEQMLQLLLDPSLHPAPPPDPQDPASPEDLSELQRQIEQLEQQIQSLRKQA
ncbi:MAG: polyhydroxyalkanoate synthesis regulator DNA-binding domain-containing protein [Longilinea sp.]|nr:polyhydroxyalkanoate synthesis regulator DNA-binding domain-containing protein [Longilinea sp.]MCA1954568.1 polyhydroxyalkanoate synthesis regulator DNA-binding domain-containing protein [Anaerolinea sp.]